MGAVLRSPHNPPCCWASREPFSDRVCLLQPDPCEKVYFAISFYKVMVCKPRSHLMIQRVLEIRPPSFVVR